MRSQPIHDELDSVVRYLVIGLVVFFANAGLLVLQLVGGRLLAPVIGSSLETWTAVIGMFLAGISAGNWYGGKVADRSATGRTLQWLIWFGALATLWALATSRVASATTLLYGMPLLPRIAMLTFVTCFPAAFILSMTTPVAIKLLLPDVRHTGQIVGVVYALGTLGSLIGNFLTGFYLMEYLGVMAIVLGVAGILFALGIAVPPRLEAQEMPELDSDRPALAENRIALPVACATVFVASFCAMALEMIASRLLAASHGVSIYTWTGIIGVVLAGTIVGNSLGGWIADRLPRRETLGASLFWAGVFTAFIIFAIAAAPTLMDKPAKLAEDAPFWSKWFFNVGEWVGKYLTRWKESPLPWQIVGAAGGMFFLPMIAFGSISPQATRLAARDWDHAGRVAGRVYACSCAGAIAGTFATGWLLIGSFGSLFLVLLIAAAMMVLAIIVGGKWRNPVELIGAGTVLAVLGLLACFGADTYLSMRPYSAYAKESNYYLIAVNERQDGFTGETHLVLVLDQLIHSRIYGEWEEHNGKRRWKTDLSRLGYGHENVQSEFARAATEAHEHPQVMVIGGGGYTLPRWLDKYLPQIGVDVVEIDPAVTEAVYAFLGMPRDTKIRTHNMDGRQFVQERAVPGSYHLIIQDAVNDLSVPYHIMTKEYNAAIKKALAPDGVYLLTVIDEPDGLFLNAAIRTMQASFPHVSLLADFQPGTTEDRAVYVIAGTPEPLELTTLQGVLARHGIAEISTKMMPPAELERLLARVRPVVFTDDYAPVDNLLAATFRKRDDFQKPADQ